MLNAGVSGSANLSPVWAHMTNDVISHAKGLDVYTSDGKRFLDFTSGIGVTNTGHCHPRVVEAIREQAGNLIHGQINIGRHKSVLELGACLKEIMPDKLDCFFFASSGAEAVESALKLARRATGRPGVVVFQGGFHGRTIGAMSLTTSKTAYRGGYQPLMPGVTVAPFPYPFRQGVEPEEASRSCLRELRHLFISQALPEETAAVLIEPILGEGGYVFPPESFLKGVQAICREHGILLILDEVQTGFGRTGRFFAFEHFGLDPDIVIMAKGLASGMPLSAIASSRTLMERWPAGTHGSTYGGNAVACAAAVATIRTMIDENLVERSEAMGKILLNKLRDVQANSNCIGEVRGKGLMIATEFGTRGEIPTTNAAKIIQKYCFERNLIILVCGPYGNVIRWIPALTVSEEQISEAVRIFTEAVADVDGRA